MFLPARSASSLQWRRLGYFSFDPNERSRHEARELKSVHLNTLAAALRVVVHAPIGNNLNVYNQIGVVAINVHGRLLSPRGLTRQLGGPGGGHEHYPGFAPKQAVGGGADGGAMDAQTRRVLQELAARKADAIEREDYDAAKSVKLIMERVRAVGRRVGELEARKLAAVNNEDFDLAKRLKAEVDAVRTTGLPQALAGGGSGSQPGAAAQPGAQRSEMDVFSRALTKGDRQRMALGSDGGGEAAQQASKAAPLMIEESEAAMGMVGDDPYGEEGYAPAGEVAFGVSVMPRSMEDRPLPRPKDDAEGAGPGTAHYPDPSEVNEDDMHGGLHSLMSPGAARQTRQRPKAQTRKGHGGPQPEGPDAEFFGDLPPPEAVEGSAWKDARPLVEAMGISEYVASCLYSKNWQLREAALQRLTKGLDGGEYTLEDGSSFAATVAAMRRALADKVASVYYRALPLLKACLTVGPAQGLRARDVAPHAPDLVAPLVERCGNSQARIRDAALDALLFLARSKEVGLPLVAQHALVPVRNKKAARDLVGRCQLLGELVQDFGVGDGASGSALDSDAVMERVGDALGSAAAEARAAAMRTALEVYRAGGDLEAHLQAAGVPRMLGEQLRAGMGAIDSGADVDAAVSAAEAANVSHRIPHKGGAARPNPPPKRDTAPRRSQAKAPQPSPAPRSAKKRTPAKPKPKPKAKQPSPSAAPPPIDEYDEGEFEADVPSLEAELEARASELGADHPDVAAVQLDLAVARNEAGEAESAVELYEKALATLERERGPDHIDVAQTLVDLAIIHLEHARNDVGRPMLERALAIRESALGPDHEDVEAIRGVLEDPTFQG